MEERGTLMARANSFFTFFPGVFVTEGKVFRSTARNSPRNFHSRIYNDRRKSDFGVREYIHSHNNYKCRRTRGTCVMPATFTIVMCISSQLLSLSNFAASLSACA